MIKRKQSQINKINFMVANAPKRKNISFMVPARSTKTNRSPRLYPSVPIMGMMPMRPGTKVKGYNNLMYGSSLSIPKRSSTNMFMPMGNRPAAAFWGDSDRDGVYNGFDCQPNNRYQHGWVSSAR